jgi:hypothetical protein
MNKKNFKRKKMKKELNKKENDSFEIKIEDVITASEQLKVKIDYNIAEKLYKKLDLEMITFEVLESKPDFIPLSYNDWLLIEGERDTPYNYQKWNKEENEGYNNNYQNDSMLKEIKSQLKNIKEWKIIKNELKNIKKNNKMNDYIKYENKVIEKIEKFGEMTRSDAQGIIMLPYNEEKIKKGFKEKTKVSDITKSILKINPELENNSELGMN